MANFSEIKQCTYVQKLTDNIKFCFGYVLGFNYPNYSQEEIKKHTQKLRSQEFKLNNSKICEIKPV